MTISRRKLFVNSVAAAAAASFGSQSKASTSKPGMPGAFPGRVVAVTGSGKDPLPRVSP